MKSCGQDRRILIAKEAPRQTVLTIGGCGEKPARLWYTQASCERELAMLKAVVSRRYVLLVLISLGVLLPGWVLLRQPPLRPGVMLDNYRKVQAWMGKKEVSAILGGPGEAESSCWCNADLWYWRADNDHFIVRITYNDSERVESKGCTLFDDNGILVSNEDVLLEWSWLSWLRRWFGL